MAKKKARTAKKKAAPKTVVKKKTRAPMKSAKPVPSTRAKKSAPKRSAASAALDPSAPVPVKTGPGASPSEIGGDLVALFNDGKFAVIEGKWWSPAIVSCEGEGVNAEWRGRKAVEAKNAWWTGENEMLGAAAEGPFLGSSGFAVRYRMQYKVRASGEIKTMSEVGVYTVQNGKIVREEFMYGP